MYATDMLNELSPLFTHRLDYQTDVAHLALKSSPHRDGIHRLSIHNVRGDVDDGGHILGFD